MNSINRLKLFNTQIVADTGDIDLIKKYNPIDVTTNPSLILSICKQEKYKNLLTNDLEETLVNFGSEIYKEVEGYVSTEVNPKYSYDTEKTIEIALKIIHLYEKKNIDKNRILIKIASTWEGIRAAEILERDYNIKCNMTLIFSLEQAIECAKANVTLISPFVGRIDDWYKQNKPEIKIDMGVENVTKIFNYYKQHEINTIIMGASFRNIHQIKSLAGIDKLTISPKLIEELTNDTDEFNCTLFLKEDNKYKYDIHNKREFYKVLENDKMANEKLNEGIIKFILDTEEVINIINK
jgi:transaldolase